MKNFESYRPVLPKPDKGSFNLAETEGSKEDVYESSKNLADYISQEEIKNVFFLDSSARQAYIGLKEMWKKEHAEEPEPDIYFINPDPLKYETDRDDMTEKFNDTFTKINKNDKVLIYDVCIHTGNTMNNTLDFFKSLGFSDIKLAVTSVSSDFKDSELLDMVCLDKRADLACHPYGKPSYINKIDSIISTPNSKEKNREQGRVDHKKIKDIFK